MWISERTLLQGVSRVKAKELPHRPDAVLYEDSEIIAIEVELSRKSIALLSNILVSLVHDEDYHGETYHDLKATVGMDKAQLLCQDDWKNYTSINYYAPAPLRTYIRSVMTRVVREGRLSQRERELISVLWYPPTITDEDCQQEELEDD